MDITQVFIAIIGGLLAGSINTLAGNGSAITLSILTEIFGLPGTIANGTNRVGVLAQSATSAYTFHNHGKLNLSASKWILGTAMAGAIVGVFIAVSISNDVFMGVFRHLMLFMLVVVLIKPSRWIRAESSLRSIDARWVLPIYFLVGVYGGFIQMGMGIFMLASLVLLSRYDMISGNALKNTVTALYTALILIIFEARGMIHWPIGLLLASGQITGGFLAAKFASKNSKASLWSYRLLVLVVVLVVIKQFMIPDLW